MTDRDDDRSRSEGDQLLSSDELIRRAKKSLKGKPDDKAIEDIVGDLEDIDVDLPVEDEFPDPLPRMQSRPRQQDRPRRVVSSYETGDDPFDRDAGPPRRAVIAAIVALLLILAGGAIAFFAAANGL